MQDMMSHHKGVLSDVMKRMEGAIAGGPTPEGKVLGVAGVALEDSTNHATRALEKYTTVINSSQSGSYGNIRNSVADVANHVQKDADAWGNAVSYAKATLGEEHPLYTMLRDVHSTKQYHYHNFINTWDMKDDIAFENIMKNNNLNPDQFK